ncbi:MAG: adenosine kinase [Geminicoccaceae bacterium]|nr:adenosine kinase [Geminicoccaceae bacterium]MCX7630504.1 adenosine kinase [Geminicoccaceae bacterium]MDW8124951.1 adenosine kinase [Geminicoccaceae bacterium]
MSRLPTRPETPLDVLGIGNAIVDVLAYAEDALLEELGLVKGAMTLVDEERIEALYRRMGPAREVSGGSCANTVAALAGLGGRAAFIGRVKDDEMGKVFAHDIRNAGVLFRSRPASDGPATARCLVFVTPDAQRTMQTYLGACVELGPQDVEEELVAAAAITYLEGYLWDRPEAKAACRKAAAIAHAHGRQVALTLSDPFCVRRWREEFRALVEREVDILFANEAEITALYETTSFDEALQQVRREVPFAALTRGAKGSVVVRGEEVHVIDAAPVARLIDTTGAGDLYAAGFLRALTLGLDLGACGRLGSLCAAEIIQQFGARAERPLGPLLDRLR